MPAVFEPETPILDASTNDSHIHIDHEAKARRDKLQLTLKPGETDEVSAIGTRWQCAQCNPDGDLPPVERPSNLTYDRTFAAQKQNEMDELKRELAEMKAMMKEQLGVKKAAPPKASTP